MPPATAAQLKERGNEQFKVRKFAEAAKFYAQAEKLSPDDPIYSSNLSAALYELGDYRGCFDAIKRSASKIEEIKTDPLSTKLSVRLAKTLTYGLMGRALTLSDGDDEIVKILDRDASDQTWATWRRVQSEWSVIEKTSNIGTERLTSLSVYRARVEYNAPEYFCIGTDDPMSIVHDWGPDDDDKNRMNLNIIPEASLKDLSFFWGGAGDGRHIFGSIIGLEKAYSKLKPSKQKKINFHLTLLDLHPTALVRDICLLLLLDQLISGQSKPPEEVAITKATVFYAWFGIVLPSYCEKKFMDVANKLVTDLQSPSPDLPSSIYIDQQSIPSLISSLKYWQKNTPNKTTYEALEHHTTSRDREEGFMQNMLNNPMLSSSFHRKLAESMKQREETINRAVASMTEEQLLGNSDEPCPQDRAGRIKWMKNARKETKEFLLEYYKNSPLPGGPGDAEFMMERAFYDESKAFLPPPILRGRHQEMQDFWTCFTSKKYRQNPENVRRSHKQLVDHINKEWRPNPSLFDRADRGGDGYPNLQIDAFSSLKSIDDFARRMGLMPKDGEHDKEAPAYAATSLFFDAVANALKVLNGRITLEIIVRELSQGLSQIKSGVVPGRPEHFPKTFARMWLSNVPDYTHGPLNTAMFAVPSLNPLQELESTVAANCMLNTNVWEAPEHFCANYTLLPIKDVPRFLGCKVISMRPTYGLIQLAPMTLPRPLAELASREELQVWLCRLLIYILLQPPAKVGMYRVIFPNCLVAFVRILQRLAEIGFPSHWIGEFLQQVLDDKLVTNVPPYLGSLPIPPTEVKRTVQSRQVYLGPWLMDFETILAVGYGSIPFPLRLPAGFAKTFEEIGMYEAPMQSSFDLTYTPRMTCPDGVVSLVFYKSNRRIIPREVGENLAMILEGRPFLERGSLYILTSVEKHGKPGSTIRWRMSKKRFENMKAETGWKLAAYLSDVKSTSTPIPSTFWVEVNVS